MIQKKLPILSGRLPTILYYLAVTAVLGMAARSATWNIGGDGIPYISIAQHYASGHWKEAVNAYWSPLLSWTMTPFVALGIDGEVAYRILVVITAVAILFAGQKIVNRYTKDKPLASIVYQGSTFVLLLYAVQYFVTPDLLVALWAIVFVFMLSKASTPFGQSRQWLVWLGVLGGIGYLTKAVLLPIFIVSTIVWFLFLAKAPRNMRFSGRVRHLAMPFLALSMVVAVWVVPLSFKYESFTLGSAGEYSLSFIGPHSVGHPFINGLQPPPNRFAVTPWEDPTMHPYASWSPLRSVNDFSFYLGKVLTGNIPGVVSALNQLSPFLIGTFWVIILLLISGNINRRHRSPLVVASLLGGVFALAYCASQVVGGGRYLWPILILNITTVSILVGNWPVYAPRLRLQWAFRLTALAFPLLIFIAWYGYLFPASRDPYYPVARQFSQSIKEKVPPRSRFASNSYGTSATVAYFANLSGYGTTQPGLTLNDPLVQKSLRQNGIEYYLYIEYPKKPVDLTGFDTILTTSLEYGDPVTGLPYGTHQAYLIKLK